MTADDRGAMHKHRFFLLAVTCLCSVFWLSGCSEVRRSIGLDRTMPDEFAVESRAPLVLPPDYDLRPPQPGAPRPQEMTAAERARRVIESAGPGEPGKQATNSGPPPKAAGERGQQPDPNQQLGDQSLSAKLLGTGDTTGGAAVERRETSAVKGVF
jgi:hypothetical protein